MMHIDITRQTAYLSVWSRVMRRENYPTKEELNRIFKYDPDTGKLYNRVYRNSRSKAGQEAGCLTKSGYLSVGINYKSYFAHNLIWIMNYGCIPDQMIDHENRNKSDNRLINLRVANSCENQYNRPAPINNTSGYKGVCWCVQTKKWQAIIKANGKRKHLGRFKTKEEAYRAYCEAAEKLHGPFSRK